MTDGHPITVDGEHVPHPLQRYAHWVVWSPSTGKVARAPWQEGHMYPAEWAADKDVDPRTTYEQAHTVASTGLNVLRDRYPFPPDATPERVIPTLLLPTDPEDSDLVFVDFDDVVVDNRVPDEVWAILERLRGYVEVSRSGEGLHVWVRGSLPDGHGKFIAPLDSRGQLEIYDHGRMTGCTWQHVAGTPTDAVPEREDTIGELVAEYATRDCPECGAWVREQSVGENTTCPECGGKIEPSANSTPTTSTPSKPNRPTPTGDRNPYYQLDIRDVADTGPFGRYRRAVENPAHDDWQGPHPKHGGTSTADAKSSNFNVEPGDGVWHCFAHGSGGGSLSLVAVLEGVVSCQDAHAIHQDKDKLLRTCLAARDSYPGQLEKATPPYDALVRVAELAGLSMADGAAGTLGRTAYSYAVDIYDAVDKYAELEAMQEDD